MWADRRGWRARFSEDPETGTVSAPSRGTCLARLRDVAGPDALLTVFDRSGRRLSTVGPPADYSQITLSPDGKKLAIDRRDVKANNYDLWMLELASGV